MPFVNISLARGKPGSTSKPSRGQFTTRWWQSST